ncbi:phosphoribosylformylglycinamidine synthase [Fusobacterium pseudoperiodonticum]|nr:phosphoribosylformylglycinamidine synthase [Fusobacterium pseudoperiodonticum]
MSDLRFFVEKKKGFDLDAKRLEKQLREELGIDIKNLRLINCYDIFNLSADKENVKKMILSEPVTDSITEELDLKGKKYFAVEFLPGQFDQRADSAIQCIDIVSTVKQNVDVLTSKIIILNDEITDEELNRIKKFYINPIEMREKDLSVLKKEEILFNSEVITYDNFTSLNDAEIEKMRTDLGLSMSFEDLKFVQDHYKEIGRNPTETEIKVLDTYWSDHCRHTTFETKINKVTFPNSEFGKQMEKEFNEYLKLKEDVSKKRVVSLMDMATIVAKYLKKEGKLDNLEVSEENNACSVYVDVEVEDFEGKKAIEKWLLMFKNETHNHPTEIEPFGGASTCLGGAIRDPLSGRAYVYQAIRVTGSGNPLETVEETLKGKLPQKKITTGAASGYSSYGNQIGIATTLVSEIYHDGYKAKRMEVGAVVAAAPVENVVRKSPTPGDSIIIIGGKTGRDGCGGATGSSKEHNDKSLLLCGAEVQKGNAPEERKIQRLFRNAEATKLIKKCNDFGAGGVSVAIGELADGVEVNLDLVPVKYEGLNGTELAISESQERMAVIISKEDTEKFLKFVDEENLLGTVVGYVTDKNRLTLNWKGKAIVDISRDFLNTNGVQQNIDIEVRDYENENVFEKFKTSDSSLEKKWLHNIKKLNVASQKGLVEMFDSSVGAGTILAPFGGKYQMSPTDVSIMKFPVLDKNTDTASAITWGFNPYISEWSTYHGAIYAVVESLAKLVAAGVDYKTARLSFQEYFEKLGKDAYKWSKPFLALLGAMKAQKDFDVAAIGGKDSMSGTFNDISVPPTLISFAVSPVNIHDVISTEFKKPKNKLYLVENKIDEKDFLFNSEELKENFEFVLKNIKNKKIVSAMVIKMGGLAEALSKMSFGNRLGFDIDNKEVDFFSLKPASILIETTEELSYKNAIYLGEVSDKFEGKVNGENINLENVESVWLNKLKPIFPYKLEEEIETYDIKNKISEKKTYKSSITIAKPRVVIAAFPGTNSEYDMYNRFNENGAEAKITLLRNLTQNHLAESVDQMCKDLRNSQIFVLPGGFSAGDEPDGSGKFMAAVLQNPKLMDEIKAFLGRDGLILGVCNGFQALVKSGLLPYGEIGNVHENSPTLTFNKIGRHISQLVKTKIVTNNSPWLSSFEIGETFDIPVSHGEGRFYASDEVLKELFENGQIATQYVDFDLNATSEFRFNPNGSSLAIEGIISPDGKIFGKMGHSERYSRDAFKNIPGNKDQNLILNGIKYFK